MIRRAAAAALCLLLAWLSCGALAAQAPLLWRIEGLRATHYLLGAVHLLPPSSQPFPAAMETAFEQAETLVFETDFAALQTPELQQRFLVAATAANENGLRGQLAPETYAGLAAHLQRSGLPAGAFDRFDAWFAAMSLELLRFQQAGFQQAFGVDSYYFSRAQQAGKQIGWFETPDEQIAVLDGMGPKSAEAYLRAMIAPDQPDAQSPDTLLRIWRESDVASLAQIVEEMRRDDPGLYARLLADRNARWMDSLRRFLDGREPTMIVVGAAHLVGEAGLLRRLGSAGYVLTPVDEQIPIGRAEGE